MYYQIFEIIPTKDFNYSFENSPTKYFIKPLQEQFSIYKGNSFNIYSIFGLFYLVKYDENKNNLNSIIVHDIKKEEHFIYNGFISSTILDDLQISNTIRNCQTLSINSCNTVSSSTYKITVDKKGFTVCSTLELEKYSEIVIKNIILAMAYNKKATQFLQKTTELYDNNNFEGLIQYKNEILAFDLKSYFNNPILPDRYFVQELWNVIAKQFYVESYHSEVKNQTSDLISLIENKQKEIFAIRTNKLSIRISFFAMLFAGIALFPYALKLIQYFTPLPKILSIFIQ